MGTLIGLLFSIRQHLLWGHKPSSTFTTWDRKARWRRLEKPWSTSVFWHSSASPRRTQTRRLARPFRLTTLTLPAPSPRMLQEPASLRGCATPIIISPRMNSLHLHQRPQGVRPLLQRGPGLPILHLQTRLQHLPPARGVRFGCPFTRTLHVDLWAQALRRLNAHLALGR